MLATHPYTNSTLQYQSQLEQIKINDRLITDYLDWSFVLDCRHSGIFITRCWNADSILLLIQQSSDYLNWLFMPTAVPYGYLACCCLCPQLLLFMPTAVSYGYLACCLGLQLFLFMPTAVSYGYLACCCLCPQLLLFMPTAVSYGYLGCCCLYPRLCHMDFWAYWALGIGTYIFNKGYLLQNM